MTDLVAIDGLCTRRDRGEMDGPAFLCELTAMLARSIGCSRAGVRVIIDTQAGCILRTIAMYSNAAGRLVVVPDLVGVGVSLYLKCLGKQGGTVVPDVASSPRTASLLHDYSASQEVSSLMDVGISLEGMLYGTLSCEQVCTPLQWSPRQIYLLRYTALRAAPALVRCLAEPHHLSPIRLAQLAPSSW